MCYYICCELFIEIIECVHFLHERNVIHRGLKPANILITNGINGRFVKLGDFCISMNHEFYNESQTQSSGTHKYWFHGKYWTRSIDFTGIWYESRYL